MRILLAIIILAAATPTQAVPISTGIVRVEDGVTRVRRLGSHRVAPRYRLLGDVDAKCDGVCTLVLCRCLVGDPPIDSYQEPCISGRTANQCTPEFFRLPVGGAHVLSRDVQQWHYSCEPGPAKLCAQ